MLSEFTLRPDVIEAIADWNAKIPTIHRQGSSCSRWFVNPETKPASFVKKELAADLEREAKGEKATHFYCQMCLVKRPKVEAPAPAKKVASEAKPAPTPATVKTPSKRTGKKAAAKKTAAVA